MNKIIVETTTNESGSFTIYIIGRGKTITFFTSEQIAANQELIHVISDTIELGKKHGADALAESLGLIWDNGWVKMEEHYPKVSEIIKYKVVDGCVDLTVVDPRLRQLADYLHHAFCHWNHTDGCGYEYERWNKVSIKEQYGYKIESIFRALRLVEKFEGRFQDIYKTFNMYKESPIDELEQFIKESCDVDN